MKKILLLFVFSLLLSACRSDATYNIPKEMPDEFDFLVQFGVKSKNEINTFKDTVTKDLVVDGTVTAKITFTEEEMRKIYGKMKEINILEPKNLKPKKRNCMQTPYEEDRWKIQLNGETITFYWSEENCKLTKDANQLLELRNYIFNVVKNKDEYKKLPEAKGGYL